MRTKYLFNNKQFLFSLLILLPVYIFSQSEIPIDEGLKSQGESWKIKGAKKFINNKPLMIAFGPLKTVETHAGKTKKLNRSVERELFWKNITTLKSMESGMILTYKNTDTVSVSMLTIIEEQEYKKNATGTIFNVNSNRENAFSTSSLPHEMILEFSNDSAAWRYTKTDSATYFATGCIQKLQSASDSFLIKAVDNFSGKKMKEIMFIQPVSGFIFLQNDRQIAAFQTMPRELVWISKDINEPAAKAILSTMAGLLGSMKPGTMTGN